MRLSSLARWSTLTALGALFVTAVVITPVSADGGDDNSPVFAPGSKPYQQSHGKWSAEWYQWSYSLPVGEHPLFDAPGTDGSEGQRGNVWFIGGSFLSSEAAPNEYEATADRTITIPEGTALFFPIMNAAAAELEGDGKTRKELQAKANLLADLIDPASLYLTINGTDVNNLVSYRVESPLFKVGPLPENNISAYFGYDVPEGSKGHMYGDGYYVMLKPLPVGTHTLEFGGFVDATEVFGITFKLDVKYTVIVVSAD